MNTPQSTGIIAFLIGWTAILAAYIKDVTLPPIVLAVVLLFFYGGVVLFVLGAEDVRY